MNKKKPVLIDCDGVVCSYVDGCIKLANQYRKTPIDYDSVVGDTREYDWWDEADLSKETLKEGFCLNLPIIPGSQEFVEELRRMDLPIMFVTSPLRDSKYWTYERTLWLQRHFNVKRTELTFATEKRYVNGLTFLDDHIDNVLRWAEYQGKSPILIEQPWNEKVLEDCIPIISEKCANRIPVYFHIIEEQVIRRTRRWDYILDFIENAAG